MELKTKGYYPKIGQYFVGLKTITFYNGNIKIFNENDFSCIIKFNDEKIIGYELNKYTNKRMLTVDFCSFDLKNIDGETAYESANISVSGFEIQPFDTDITLLEVTSHSINDFEIQLPVIFDKNNIEAFVYLNVFTDRILLPIPNMAKYILQKVSKLQHITYIDNMEDMGLNGYMEYYNQLFKVLNE